jgi:hypothetical protein
MIRQVVVASDDPIVQVYLCLNFCDFKLAHLFSRAAHRLMGTAVQLSVTASTAQPSTVHTMLGDTDHGTCSGGAVDYTS